jgi:hypothetical protein
VLAGDERGATEAMLPVLNRAATAERGMVAIVGAGPGDPDLLTLRALQLMEQADVVLPDALVAPAILDRVRRDAIRSLRRAHLRDRGPDGREARGDCACCGSRGDARAAAATASISAAAASRSSWCRASRHGQRAKARSRDARRRLTHHSTKCCAMIKTRISRATPHANSCATARWCS